MPASWRTSDLTVLAVAGVGTVLLTGGLVPGGAS